MDCTLGLHVGSRLSAAMLAVALGMTAGDVTVLAVSYDRLPNGPLSPADSLAGVPDQDRHALTFGNSSGTVLVVGLENYRLWSRRSTDSGAVFGGEASIDVAADVHQVRGRLAADGKLYLAYVVADAAGGLGVRVIRSDDLGLTWLQPQGVIQGGTPGFPASSVALATGPSGSVAVIASGGAGLHPYVSFSSNGGLTWTTPVRGDPGATTVVTLGEIDVAVDDASRIHAVYIQDRGTVSRIYRTRSLDGGVTFAAETQVVLSLDAPAIALDLESGQDGNMLLAANNASDDGFLDARLYVLRSVDGGASYSTSLTGFLSGTAAFSMQPRLVVDPATATTFVLARSPFGSTAVSQQLLLWRSIDAGASWTSSTPAILATTLARLPGGRPVGEPQMKRAAPSTWMIGWSDSRIDTYFGRFRNLYARLSTDDGATFQPEIKIDDPTPFFGTRTLTGMSSDASGNVHVVWTDGRDENSRSENVYADRMHLSTPVFLTDTRLDVDGWEVTPESSPIGAVAADGASRVYHAFSANTTGPYPDLWVAVSTDLGGSFLTPVRVGDTGAGSRISDRPLLRAFSDGRVYLLYFLHTGVGVRELRFNRSLDFGATWQPTDIVIATQSVIHPAQDVVQIAGLADGTVYVVWASSELDILMRKSTDSGATFAAATPIDQDPSGSAIAPEICADGNRLLVTYHANTAPQEAWHAIVSEDRGATWLPLFVLRTPALPGASYMGSLACGPGGTASFVWPDARSGAVELYSTRFAGTSWTADVPGATPPGSSPKWPSATFSSAGTAVVAYEAGSGEVYVSRSVDGGATYSSFARLDGTAPDPTAPSRAVRTIADGSGNVWARFLDRSGGLDRIVARSSVDDGLTWGTLRRLSVEYSGASREDAVGADYWIEGDAAAAAGNAYFVWGGNRFSPFPDPLINIWDADDLDRDGQSSGTDCNDLDPSVQLAPVEVSGVVVGKDSGAAVISWQSQSGAGSATTYDIVGGSVVSLRSMGGFGGALCRAEDFPGSTFGDPTTLPVGDGWYYLIRASNACGIGAYGDSSLVPDPRDALSSAPCM